MIHAHLDKLFHIFTPAVAGITIFSITTFTNIFEWSLRILVLLITLGFTSWKWRKEYLEEQKTNKKK